MSQITIAWSTSRERWEVWKMGENIAHSRQLKTAQRRFPEAVLVAPHPDER